MMGFAGQLSLGHSLYVGVGAYAAAALFVHYGIGPWVGLWRVDGRLVAAGAVIGFLAFRFGVSGVYFALLTIAFAEFTRIGFDHWSGSAARAACSSRWRSATRSTCSTSAAARRCTTTSMLALTAGAFALCHAC